MSFSSHPGVELKLGYQTGTCSAGAALAVATHMAMCSLCTQMGRLGAWAGDLPQILASDHGHSGQTYAEALGVSALEDWRQIKDGVRIAAFKNASSLGEAVYLIEAAFGASIIPPGQALLVVLLQGQLTYGSAWFERGDLIDSTTAWSIADWTPGPHGCICLLICEAI